MYEFRAKVLQIYLKNNKQNKILSKYRKLSFKMLVVRLLVWSRSPQYLSYQSYDCLYERLHKSHILIAQIWSYESSYESHTTHRTKARTKCNLNLPSNETHKSDWSGSTYHELTLHLTSAFASWPLRSLFDLKLISIYNVYLLKLFKS